ncbi:MAG: hypothetical protein AAGF12_40445 [Myxococcota bacterium]
MEEEPAEDDGLEPAGKPTNATQKPGEPDPIEVAWDKVEAEWNNAEVHRKFIRLCASLDRLPEAGVRYRAVRDRGDERSDAAKAHIDQVLSVAMRSLEPLKSEPRRGPPLVLKAVAVLIFVGLVGGAAFILLDAARP